MQLSENITFSLHLTVFFSIAFQTLLKSIIECPSFSSNFPFHGHFSQSLMDKTKIHLSLSLSLLNMPQYKSKIVCEYYFMLI